MPRTISRLLTALGLLGATGPLSAQSSRLAVADSISRWTTTVDAGLSRMRQTAVDLPNASTEGGQLILYGIGGSLQKLVATYAGETGRATECYYVRGDTLRYFSRREVHYDRPLSGHVIRLTVERLWFVGDSAVQWSDTLGQVRRAGTALAARSADVRREFRNTFQLSHGGYPSRDQMSNERCN